MGAIKNDESERELHDAAGGHARATADPVKLAQHIAEHMREAYAANGKLRDPELRAAANRASEATEGRVQFAYSTAPESTTFYVFNPDGQRHTKAKALEYLLGIVARPEESLL